MTIEIVLLAMVAVFVGLRLYAVLGHRTGHEQQPVTRPDSVPDIKAPAPASDAPPEKGESSGLVYEEAATNGIRAIISADPGFDISRFLEGAQTAYRMILESFWRGEQEELAHLVGDDVRASFAEAIASRNAAGHKLDNRLIAIERAIIQNARLDGRVASIDVRFDADIAAVTRDSDDQVVAGSLTDAVEVHDIWTFSRTIGSSDPNWLLVETGEG